MPEVPATGSDPPARRLAGTRFGEVRWFTSLDSTNRYLLDEAAAGAPDGVVAVADVQTAGRGRLDRVWEAPPRSSLLASVLLRSGPTGDQAHLAVTAAALAAARAVEEVAGVEARLKWPNDLVVGDRKLAGLLAEVSPGGAVVVGLGLNVDWPSFPPELAGTATSCNLEAGRAPDRSDLLVAWLVRLEGLLASLDDPAGREGLRAAAVERSATLGRRVHVDLGHRSFEGVATGLTPEGFLEVTVGDRVEIVAAGDVVHLRPARP